MRFEGLTETDKNIVETASDILKAYHAEKGSVYFIADLMNDDADGDYRRTIEHFKAVESIFSDAIEILEKYEENKKR